MAEHLGYTTHTRNIPIEFFLGMIEGDIKKLIHTHGHKNCGLSYEDVCEEIQKIIHTKKKAISKPMDDYGRNKLDREWRSKKNGFLKKLFEEEGFINKCVPKKNYPNNPSINQLLSRHIKFCKEKDVKREAVEKNFNFKACREYDSWIETQRKSFHQEYLKNVREFGASTVNKYFSTKEHTQGHDPVKTYLNSKLDCNQYNPSLKSHTKKQLDKETTKELQPPMEPNNIPGSQGKDGGLVTDKDSEIAKTKSEEKKTPRPKSHTPHSQIPAPSKTQADGMHIGQPTYAIPKAPVSTVSRNGENQETTPIQGQSPTNIPPSAQAEAPRQAKSSPLPQNDTIPTTAIQNVPVPTATTSSSSTLVTVNDTTSSQTTPTSPSLTVTSDSSPNSGSPLPSNVLPPVADTKDQDRAPQSSTTSGTFESTHSNQSVLSTVSTDSSLSQPQDPVLTVSPAVTTSEGSGTFISSSANAITTTTAAPASDTISTMITTKAPILSTQQAPSASSSQEAPHTPDLSGPKETAPNKEPQPALTQTPTSLSGNDTRGISVSIQPDNNQQASLSSESSSITKDLIKQQGVQSENSITSHSEYTPNGSVVLEGAKLQKNVDQTDTKHNIFPVRIGNRNGNNQLTPSVTADPEKNSDVKSGKDLNSNPVIQKGKNDNPNFISEEIPPLTHIIPTLLVILGTITLLFQLYKYTPFGLLLGRRRKRKKRDLRRIHEIPEKPAYESPNIALHQWEDHNLVGQTVENDVYTKLLKINRYKQEMQKRKKENKKTLIEVHMEVLEEYKSDEWELHKGDFLEICLRGFINEENDDYSKLPNTELTEKSTKNDKIIEDIQKKEILWNNWIENHRNILEQWKKKEWFHILKNKWKKEQQIYKEKNNKLQKNISNEQDTHSIVSKKETWKQWILKQATLIDMFNKEDWFKSMVYVQDKEKDNCRINEYNNISVTSKTELRNEKTNEGRSKNIIQKLMVQIHMLVLEECIKEDIIKQKELCIDNIIEDIHTKNNYDEDRNMPQCDTDNFKVPEFEEIHTSKNK